MEQALEVGVDELLDTLKRKGIPLPFEIGSFIALEVSEQLLRAVSQVRAADVVVGPVGEISLLPIQGRASAEAAVRSVLVLLGELLVCSAPGVPPMLLELVEHGPSSGQWSLERLRDDLEACLVPLNRGATRRVLARLLREIRKHGERPSARPATGPDGADLDAEVDALLGIEAGPKRKRRSAPSAEAEAEADEPALAAIGAAIGAAPPAVAGSASGESDELDVPHAAQPTAADPREDRQDEPTHPRLLAKREMATRPAPSAPSRALHTEEFFESGDAPRSIRGGTVLALMFLFVSLVLVVAYLSLGRDVARKLLGVAPSTDESAATSSAVGSVVKPRRLVGELRVTSEPARAEVFLLVGRGPVLVDNLPVGAAHEFLALAEGRAPTRANVPSDAVWEQADGHLRYELALQTTKLEAHADPNDLAATLSPRDLGQATGTLGTVRVITAPPGASVYQLIGFTPDVRVDNLPLDQRYELLVYAKGRALEKRHLDPSDFKDESGRRVAALDVRLSAKR